MQPNRFNKKGSYIKSVMLARIIKQDEKEPLSIEMLGRLVPSWCRVTFYDRLSRYRTLKAAMQGKKCMIVLYQIHTKKKTIKNQAGHFILINTANKVEYFSSSGWSVSQELSETHSDPKIFHRLLGENYIENRIPLEKFGDSNTCWRFCLARAVLSDLPLKDFQKLFSHHLVLENPDDIVTALTMLHTDRVKKEIKKNTR